MSFLIALSACSGVVSLSSMINSKACLVFFTSSRASLTALRNDAPRSSDGPLFGTITPILISSFISRSSQGSDSLLRPLIVPLTRRPSSFLNPFFVAGPSLRPDLARNHVHHLRTTHAPRLRQFRSKAPFARTVCYHASYLGKGT